MQAAREIGCIFLSSLCACGLLLVPVVCYDRFTCMEKSKAGRWKQNRTENLCDGHAVNYCAG